jgi:DNA-binding MarR family transcriptional regulator
VAPTGTSLRSLATELEPAWIEIGRLFLSRRNSSPVGRDPEDELSTVQHVAITALRERPMRIGELACHVGLAESSVTRLVDRLEARGLAERRPLPGDRRGVVVGLTGAGALLAEAAATRRRAYLTDILKALEPDERRELIRLFGKVAAVHAGAEGVLHAARSRA